MNDMIQPGFGRFGKHIAIGAAISGVVSSIPLLNCLNCIFCLLNMAGVVLALTMYLKANPQEQITQGEAALFGVAAGAGAGFIAGCLGFVLNMAIGSVMANFLQQVPEASRQFMASSMAGGVIMIPVNILLYGAFGALGGFLGLMLFHKTRIRRA